MDFFSHKPMPSQKKTTAQKVANDFEWAKDSMDSLFSMILFQNQGLRQSRLNKKINYDLYNGILDKNDMERICNPHQIEGATFPAEVKHYPLINPKVNTLKGEESKRRFDWRVVVINPDAISEKQEEQKKQYAEFIVKHVQDQGYSEEEAAKELEKLQQYLKYDFRNLKELKATRLLTYYTKYLDVKTLFNRGWEDAIIAGEEIYCIEEVCGEPKVRKCNPLNTYFLTYPDSNYIEDCDAILEEGYVPIGDILDDFYDELDDDDITFLETKGKSTQSTASTDINYSTNMIFSDPSLSNGGLIDTNMIGLGAYGGAFDTHGNVRKVKIKWRSMRPILVLHYFDENGNEQERDVDENYIANEAEGEWTKKIWIGEWWEGYKIANHLYKKIRPAVIQFRKLDNKSYCASGYVGSLYNTNSNRVQSLFDLMKPYNYQYDAYMYRTEMAFIKAKGRIGELDLANVPEGWKIEQWMYYAEILGWAVKDSFKESKKGVSTGKLAGNMNSSSNVLNLELGNYIQQHIDMLEYVERQLDKISGIAEQRQGQVETSAGLGTTQQAVEASRTITEPWFAIHDNIKVRVLAALLETAKYCMRGKTKKIQYIMDDTSQIIDEIDGDLINDAEFGILVTNSSADTDLMKLLKDLAHAGIQNDKISFSELIDIHMSESISQIRQQIRQAEEKRIQLQQEAEKAQQQHEQSLHQMQVEHERELQEYESEEAQKDRDLKQYEIDVKAETEIHKAEIATYNRQENLDQDGDGIPDPIEIGKLALDRQDVESKSFLEQQKLTHEKDKHKKELAIKEKELADKKEIENKKIKAIEVQNKSQELMQDKELKFKEKEIKFKEKELKSKQILEQIKLRAAKAKASQAAKKTTTKK